MTNISALQSALSGLLAQRQRLDVIGHNVANANTDGYSRQRADLVSGGRGPVPALYSTGLITGDGVDVAGVSRSRDDFLEARVIGERSANANLAKSSTYLDRIELVHAEPSDDGLAASLDALWAAFDEVANYPDEIPQRQAALEQANTLVEQFRFMDGEVRALHATAVLEAGALVSQVNDLAAQVADLNDAIRPLYLGGANANDLLDQRDLAVARLAELVGGVVHNRDDGTVNVTVADSTIVSGSRSVELQTDTVVDPALADVGLRRLRFMWASGQEVVPDGGEAAALVTSANIDIPDAIRSLDGVAASLVSKVNTLHSTGQDLNGTTGLNFFDPAGVTATTIAVSSDVVGQPDRIAAADTGAGLWDATIAQSIADLREADDGPDADYAQLVGSLGVRVGSARARSNAQQGVLDRVDQARLSARAVNIDEEMIDLVAAQRAYEASARVINAVDEMLDQLVNRLGLVGR